jgi:hypothetical protein
MMVYRRLSERRAEEERAALERDWMTLLEGIELIKHVDAESKVEVKRSPYEQICDAIEEGELRARWLDETPPPRGPRAWGIPLDKPQNFIGVLRRPKVRLQNGGEILCGHPLEPGRSRWRKLLLSREDMRRIVASARSDNAELRQLSNNAQGKEAMHEAISAIFDLASEQGVKSPNIVEMRNLASRWLEKHRGVTARASWIEELAADPRYNSRRGKPGVTVQGRLLPVSKLQI